MSILVPGEEEEETASNAPSSLLFPSALLLPPRNEQLLVAVGLVEPALEVAHLAPLLKDGALELERLELDALPLLDLDEERVRGVQVVAQPDEALEVLLVRPARLARRLDVSTTEAHVGVVLVRLVVLRGACVGVSSCLVDESTRTEEGRQRTSSCGMTDFPPLATLLVRQCAYTSRAYGLNRANSGRSGSSSASSMSSSRGSSDRLTCAIGALRSVVCSNSSMSCSKSSSDRAAVGGATESRAEEDEEGPAPAGDEGACLPPFRVPRPLGVPGTSSSTTGGGRGLAPGRNWALKSSSQSSSSSSIV